MLTYMQPESAEEMKRVIEELPIGARLEPLSNEEGSRLGRYALVNNDDDVTVKVLFLFRRDWYQELFGENATFRCHEGNQRKAA